MSALTHIWKVNVWVLPAKRYGLWDTGGYGLWVAFPREPTWWTAKPMAYHRLWGISSMGYGRFDCTLTLYYSLYSSIVHGKYILSPSLLFLISPQITEKAPTPVPLSYYQVPSIVRFLFVQSIY